MPRFSKARQLPTISIIVSTAPYFMKMHFFKAFTVNLCFGEAKHAENIYRFIFYISA